MNMKKIIILFIMSVIMLLFLIKNSYININKPIIFYKWSKINNIMIVAHPDDETLWASEELLNNDYLVVCITCGKNKTRIREIKKALEISNDKLMILNKPDKVKGIRSNWKKEKKDIEKELKHILKIKKWNKIVTHNPDGEYGHIHHKMTSEIVTKIYDETRNGKLKYFGKYYTKRKASELYTHPSLPNNTYKEKMKMINVYKSQGFIKKKFNQMFKYENLIDRDSWSKK